MTARRSLSPLARLRIFERAKGVCHLCKQRIQVGERWEVEHPIALAMGGADDETNMAPAHKKCHAGKTAEDAGDLAKAKRRKAKHVGAWKRSGFRKPPPGSHHDWKLGRRVMNKETR